MPNEKRNKIIVTIILGFIIALQLLRIVYVFAYERQGYHSDESWSYGFANSYFDPYIYQGIDEKIKNFNVWLPSGVLKDYLVVNKGEEFSYDSVYYNQQKDLSPPLHTMILHTISSIFPETFSWWYSFAINIISFVFAMILLYFIGKELTNSRLAGIATCLFYGFSIGALNTYVYLRMYAFLSLLAILSVYLHTRIFNKKFENIKRELQLLLLTTIIGILTHYYFIVFSFFIALCFCIYLLVLKKFKKMFTYAASMLLSVGLSFAAYPFMIASFAMTKGYSQMPYIWRIKYCLFVFIKETTGLTIYFYLPQFLMFCYGLLILVTFLIPICFLFRKETLVANLLQKMKRTPLFIYNKLKSMNWIFAFIFFTVVLTILVVAGSSNVLFMKEMTDRYMFFIMPLFVVLLISALYFITRKISFVKYFPKISFEKFNQVLFVAVCVLILIFNNVNVKCNYLFERNTKTITIEELSKGANCIVAMDDSWKLTFYASRLLNANKFFAMQTSDCMSFGSKIKNEDQSKPLYLILETNKLPNEKGQLKGYEYFGDKMKTGLFFTEKEFINYINAQVWVAKTTNILTENCFGGTVTVYRIYLK